MRYIPFQHLPSLEARLAELIATGTRCQVRDALGITLGLHGLRVSEVCRSTIASLDVLAGELTPPILKRGRERRIPLDPSVVRALMTWRNGSTCPWLLFTGKGQQIYPTHLERFCRAITAEVFGVSYKFHALRHTFAMRLYGKTHDLLLTKQKLGHRSISSTLVYAEALDELPRDLLVRLHTPADEPATAVGVSQPAGTVTRPNPLALIGQPFARAL